MASSDDAYKELQQISSLTEQLTQQAEVRDQFLEQILDAITVTGTSTINAIEKGGTGGGGGGGGDGKGKGGGGGGGGDRGFVQGMMDRVSIGIPGTSIRLFQLGGFIKSITQAKTPLQGFAKGMTMIIPAIFAATEGLYALGKSMGGLTGRQAGGVAMGQVGQMFAGLGEGRLRLPMRGMRAQTAMAGEFGQLFGPETLARLGDVATDLGISTDELSKVERAMQATNMSSEDAINSFKEVGILGRTAARELTKNADAVARAGDEFNSYIVESIKNAKVLGLEFSRMEKTLTGFTTDFEGTVSSFSELRAVIPGFSTDFGQLLSTAMDGTTDEFVEQIRTTLLGAGITDASQLNRQQASLLEGATGFSAAQIDRILEGEAVTADISESLDTERNSLIKFQTTMLMMGFGTVVGALIGSAGLTGLFGGKLSTLAGASIGAAGGLAVTGAAALMLNDFVYTGNQVHPINGKDIVGGLPDGPISKLAGGGGANVEHAVRKVETSVNRLSRLFEGGMAIKLQDLEKGVLSIPEKQMRMT